MTNFRTNLKDYDTGNYSPGAPKFKIIFWLLVNAMFLKNAFNLSSESKIFVLRLFGAQIGRGVIIKQSVSVKYPWLLSIGDYSWIGEHVWIDNLAEVKIGSNVCLSQGAMILTGNHNYKSESFELLVKGVNIEEGVWIAAKSIVCPGVTCKSHSVLSIGAVATEDLTAYSVYQGNPAKMVRRRTE